uniref:Tetraspanin-15 n=1 Tax=Schistocephalus solidus TaxID=70667 RepID=A0A0X3PMB8_SCHSO
MGKKLLGVDQFMRVSRGLLILGTVLIGISVVQIISSVRPPFAPRKRIRMDLSLIICSLICSLLFFANSVSFFVLVSSVDSSIERAIDEQVVTAYGFDGEVTNVIDNLQVEHACCGGSNYEVYEDSRWATHPSDIVPKVGLVPDSCCVRNASTLEIVDAEACHGDTLTLPNSVYLNGCAPFLAAEERYHPLVFAFCSMLLCIWMALVSSCVFYVYKTHPRTTVI